VYLLYIYSILKTIHNTLANGAKASEQSLLPLQNPNFMYSSPFAAAAQHLHPFELFCVATFITCFPWILNTHCLTYWGWFVVAQSVSYEVHIGYDLPFMPHRWLPFYAGAPAHDM
jgi:hypothetical protein